MNSKQRYVAPKVEMLLVVLDNCVDNAANMYTCNKAKYSQPEKSKVII